MRIYSSCCEGCSISDPAPGRLARVLLLTNLWLRAKPDILNHCPLLDEAFETAVKDTLERLQPAW